MTLKQIQCSVLVCDGCGTRFSPGDDVGVIHAEQGSTAAADNLDDWVRESDWEMRGGKDWCPQCQTECPSCGGVGGLRSSRCEGCYGSGWVPTATLDQADPPSEAVP